MVDKATPSDDNSIQDLSSEQLEAELARAEDELADLDEMRRFTLGQTGVHIGAARLQSLQATWTRDEAHLRARIQVLKGLRESYDSRNGLASTNKGSNGT